MLLPDAVFSFDFDVSRCAYLGIFLYACYLREWGMYFIYFILIAYHAHLDKVSPKCNMTYLFLDVSLHFLRFSLLLLPLFRSASFF